MSLLRYGENSLVCSFKNMWLKMTGSPNYVSVWLIICLSLGLGGLPGPFCPTSHHWAESFLHFGDVRAASPQVMSMVQHRESGVFGHKFCLHLVQPTVGSRLIWPRKIKALWDHRANTLRLLGMMCSGEVTGSLLRPSVKCLWRSELQKSS